MSPLHRDLNPACCNFWWAPPDEFQHRFAGKPWRWVQLPKRTWLADSGYKAPHRDSCASLAGKIIDEGIHNPVCVAALDDDREVSRGFIVPGDWYESALAATV
ncbi:hypothetical protein [Microbulbifer taiwanensis]|uniref:hypothetical protein n=1 Tax=Microbulbifer taiwanensis TaxID=986746 RepID=UPI0036061839